MRRHGLAAASPGGHSDENMLPSLDRIDSGGHHDRGTLQIVCRFNNFRKQASDDTELRRLLNLARGMDVHEA